MPPTKWQEVQSSPLVEFSWFPILACVILECVTVNVVPVAVALAALEMTMAVELVMDLIVTVSGVVLVAVKVTPVAVAVAAAVNVKLVVPFTDVATVSFGGMPGPEITVPAESDTGEAVVTVVLPLAVLAVKVVIVVVVLGIPAPLMVIPWVRAAVDAVVTVVLPLAVLAMIVEERPVLLIQGLPVLWQWTQKVGLVEALYALVPRLGCATGVTPLMVTLDSRPSWL